MSTTRPAAPRPEERSARHHDACMCGEVRALAEARAAKQAAVAAFGRFALESRDITETAARAVSVVAGLMGTPMAGLFRLASPACLRLVQGCGPTGMAPGDEVEIPEGALAAEMVRGAVREVSDWRQDGRVPRPGVAEAAGIVSTLAVAVLVDGRVWGRLGVMDTRPRQFTDADVDILEPVAHLLAAALERHRREQAQAAVVDFGRFALESRDVAATLERAVDVATHVLEAPMGGVHHLRDAPGDAELLHARGPVTVAIGEHFAIEASSLANRDGIEPLIVTDWRHETRFPRPPSARASGVLSGLAVTVRVEGRAWGRLGVMDTKPRSFSDAEVDFMSSLGHVVAAALERDRFETRLRVRARDLQRALLPAALPVMAGVETAARFAPAGGDEVGGDWYDVLALPQGGVGLVMGDVEGHDSAAAALMGQVRNVLRAYATEGYAPAEVMTRVNRFVARHCDRLVTCCYAELRPDELSFTAVSAGHPPPLVLPRAGPLRPVSLTPGPLLGFDPEQQYGEQTSLLPAGATVLLVTDGLVDDFPGAIHLGLHAFSAAASAWGDQPVETLADALVARVPDAPAQRDDAALLAVRLTTTPHPDTRGRQVHRMFRPSAESTPAARRYVSDILAVWGLSELADAATLAVSELVTNAVVHTTSLIRLTLRRADSTRLWIGVQDDSDLPAEPRRPLAGDDQIAGRGLAIVEQLADAWGVSPSPGRSGKTVWLELSAAAR